MASQLKISVRVHKINFTAKKLYIVTIPNMLKNNDNS